MGQDPLGVVVLVQEEVSAEAKGVEVEWEVPALELARVGSVSVLIVVPKCPIKWAHPATT